MQVKNTMRYNCISILMDIIKKENLTISNADKDTQQMELSYNVGGNAKWYSDLERHFDIFK